MASLRRMGIKLRELRLSAGFTRRELSEATGVSQQHVYRLEHGLRRTRRRTLQILSDAMGCPGAAGELAALAGSGLAAESAWVERIERRRLRRVRRHDVLREREAYQIERTALEAEWAARTRQHLEFRGALQLFSRAFDWWYWLENPTTRRRPRRPPPRVWP